MGCGRFTHHPYRRLQAAIATMHGKERAIAPVLSNWFEMTVIPAPGIDTDALGTFTGEIARAGTMIDAARAKARLAIERTGVQIGIGSEGSFGPHPYIPFVASGREILLMSEAQTGSEIIVHRRTGTNFAHLIASSLEDAAHFLKAVGFPEHAVIVRPENTNDTSHMVKGLQTFEAVKTAIRHVAQNSSTGKVLLQTDMRAHLNPTRMASIRRMAKLLAVRIARCCPSCGVPGYGILDVSRGLPCNDCGVPTDLVQAEIHGCKSCGHTMRRFQRPPAARAEARWCQHCNP